MTIDWSTVPLGSICTIYDGPHATPKKTKEGPIFLGISNLTQGRLNLTEVEHLSEEDFAKWTRRVAPQAGDIVFSYETRLGEAAIIPEGLLCCLGRRMGLLRPDTSKINSRFLLYAYLSPQFQQVLKARTIHGSTVDRIPLIELPSFPITIPPLPVQRRIADILGAFDDKIEVNRRISATLEAMAQALFRHWFVDFGPFQGGPFVETELGLVPEGWRVGKLPDAILINPIRRLKKGEVAPYLEMSNMPTVLPQALNWRERAYTCGGKFENGDVLVAKITPCLENGKTAFVDFLEEDAVGWGSTEYIVLRSRPLLPKEYTYYLARSEGFRAFLIRNMVGTSGRQRVPESILGSYALAIPPAGVATQFEQRVHPMMLTMKALANENRSLAATRDYLLPRLLAGEVAVETVETTMVEVL